MHSAIFVPILASLAAALPTTSTEALSLARTIIARAPADANAVLRSVTSSGTGCASNSAAFFFNGGASAIFDSLTVDSDAPANASKYCLITIDVGLDSKYKYTINKSTVAHGYTNGASATFSAVYTAGGQTSTSQSVIAQPAGEFIVDLQAQGGATSAYGGGVGTINVSVGLSQGGVTPAYVGIDSLDVTFEYSI